MTDQHLPAPAAPVEPEPITRPAAEPRRPIGVAFLPLALAWFVIIAFVIAAWTFLAATG